MQNADMSAAVCGIAWTRTGHMGVTHLESLCADISTLREDKGGLSGRNLLEQSLHNIGTVVLQDTIRVTDPAGLDCRGGKAKSMRIMLLL